MSFFSKPNVVVWPQATNVNIYLDRSENNIFSLDINLWKPLSDSDKLALKTQLDQLKIDTITILVPDDVVYTKSFIYDTEITTIDKNEVIGLAKSFISFKIYPECLNYTLISSAGKTIIQAKIFDKNKISVLESNLESLQLKSIAYESVSQSIANIISKKTTGEYFLIYPSADNEFLLLLASNNSVYLTAIIKGKDLEIQKLINYSKLYFPSLVTKIYITSDLASSIISTTPLEKISYSDAGIATEFKKTSNLPLPVIGMLVSKTTQPVIINSSDTNSPQSKMENKKNILPFIAVFVVTAALASIIIWFVLNKNSESVPENTVINEPTPVSTIEELPTSTPIPTVADISKKLKLQVLNATDINGQAAVLKEKLTNLGFTSVAVGNSKEKFTENKLQIKETQATASAYFVQELAGFFDVVPTTDLAETSAYDAVFYIGTKLVSDSTTTAPSETTVAPTAKVTAKVTAKPTVKTTGTATPTVKTTGTVTPTVKPTATPTI